MVQNLVQPGLIQGLLFIHLGSGTVRHIVRLPGRASGLLINPHRVWRLLEERGWCKCKALLLQN